jgi:hypothetical protein
MSRVKSEIRWTSTEESLCCGMFPGNRGAGSVNHVATGFIPSIHAISGDPDRMSDSYTFDELKPVAQIPRF